MVKRVEELDTIDAQLGKDLTFEYCDNIPIEDANYNTQGDNTAWVKLETPGVEVELGTPVVEIWIRTPGAENPNTNEEGVKTKNEEDKEDAETDITEDTWEISTLETKGVTEEHDVTQYKYNSKETQPIKHKDTDKALP